MDKVLLRPEEAAEILSLGRSKVFELMARGDLASIKGGRSRRVAIEDLRAYVERQRQVQGAEVGAEAPR